VISRKERTADDLLRMVEPQDLIKFGMIPEFVGRMAVTSSTGGTRRGGPEAHPAGAQERPWSSISEAVQMEGVELEFTEDALTRLSPRRST
jgi:ATP-dependent Clp protease ATP-binding subunit ClpX